MGHQSVVGAVAGFEEESHARHEPEHGRFVVRICEPDGDEEAAGGEADEGDPEFFEPEVGGDVGVEEVGDYAAEGSVGGRCMLAGCWCDEELWWLEFTWSRR